MNPSLEQLLLSTRARLEETILPAIPDDEAFAREQGTFVLRALDVILQAHPHAYRFEVLEHYAYTDALKELLGMLPPSTDLMDTEEARRLLDEVCPGRDEAIEPMASVMTRTRRIRDLLLDAAERAMQVPEMADGVAGLVRSLADDQIAREAAWLAATRYVRADHDPQDVVHG